MGKTQQEVIQAVGKPDVTQETGFTTWYYNSRTLDPVNGRVDYNAQVVFDEDGKVDHINF
jgi:outer membrane protein assembly factor BamE (lipoprotein component of BamABCDE complex)